MAIPLDQTTLEIMAKARQVPDEDRTLDVDGRLASCILRDPVTGASVVLIREDLDEGRALSWGETDGEPYEERYGIVPKGGMP